MNARRVAAGAVCVAAFAAGHAATVGNADTALYWAWSHGIVSGDAAQAIERAAGYDASAETSSCDAFDSFTPAAALDTSAAWDADAAAVADLEMATDALWWRSVSFGIPS